MGCWCRKEVRIVQILPPWFHVFALEWFLAQCAMRSLSALKQHLVSAGKYSPVLMVDQFLSIDLVSEGLQNYFCAHVLLQLKLLMLLRHLTSKLEKVL